MPLLDLPALYPDTKDLASTLFVAAARIADASRGGRAGAAALTGAGAGSSASDPTTVRDLITLAALPDPAFFGVVGNHKALARVLAGVLDDVAGARSVRLETKAYDALVATLVKITTGIRGTDADKWPHPERIASRLAVLFPAPILPALALCLQRTSGAVSAVAVTSLLIQAPSILNHLKSVGAAWCDSVQALLASCIDDARRGRFQRKAPDILSSAERAHRLTKQLWSLLQACPFVADFLCPLPKLIAALRAIVDTAAPMIQHFIMTSDELAARRQPLLRAIASVANAAVDSAVYALLFVSSHSASARMDFRLVTGPIDEALSDACAQYGPFVVQAVLKAQPSIPKLLHQLAGSGSAQGGTGAEALLASALAELDTERSTAPTVHVFAERVLTALADMGVVIELSDLGSNVQEAVKARRAEANSNSNGGSSAPLSVAAALAAPMAGMGGNRTAQSPPPPPPQQHQQAINDPAVQMILDVLPHLNPQPLPEALAYYDGSVEAFLDAAMSENLPPHLHAALHSSPTAASPAVLSASSAAFPAAAGDAGAESSRPVVPEEAAAAVERQSSVFGMLTANFGWDNNNGAGGGNGGAAAAGQSDEGSFDGAAAEYRRDTSEFFALDEGLKAVIAAMANDVYDDERDDGDDDMARGGRVETFEFDSGSDDDASAPPRRRQLDAIGADGNTANNAGAGIVGGGSSSSRGRGGGYTSKPKTVQAGRGGHQPPSGGSGAPPAGRGGARKSHAEQQAQSPAFSNPNATAAAVAVNTTNNANANGNRGGGGGGGNGNGRGGRSSARGGGHGRGGGREVSAKERHRTQGGPDGDY